MKRFAFWSAFLVLGTPALASAMEELGMIEATFDGESFAHPTVNFPDWDEATAVLFVMGAGLSELGIAGYGTDSRRIELSVTYRTEQPGPESEMIGHFVRYVPDKTGKSWASGEAATPPNFTFTTLEVDGEGGRAVGTFKAELCFEDIFESGTDPENCRPIEGSFDTALIVGQ
jgi:hypothetical protein